MALDPLEWIIIGVIVVVIFLWGPQKIPEIAKALGRARKEFTQASKEFEQASKEVVGSEPSRPVSEAVSGDEILLHTARKLGIATEGKTREQISEDILKKAN